MTRFLVEPERFPLVNNPVGLIQHVIRTLEHRVFETAPPVPMFGEWEFADAHVLGVQALKGEPSQVPGELHLLKNYPPDLIGAIALQATRELKRSKLHLWVTYVDRCVDGYEENFSRYLLLLVLAYDAGYTEIDRLLAWVDFVGKREVPLLRPPRSAVDLLDEV